MTTDKEMKALRAVMLEDAATAFLRHPSLQALLRLQAHASTYWRYYGE